MTWGKLKAQLLSDSMERDAFMTVILLWKETPMPSILIPRNQRLWVLIESKKNVGRKEWGREKLDLIGLSQACHRCIVDLGSQ